MQPLLTQLLDLSGMDVEDYSDLGRELILEVEARTTKVTCPRCGNDSTHLHQNHWHWVRDLSISQHQVLLKLNRRQFKCHVCQKPFSETFEFMGERRRHTDRFAQMVVQQVIHSDMHNVAKQHNLTDEEVASIVQYLSKKNECGGGRTKAVRNG